MQPFFLSDHGLVAHHAVIIEPIPVSSASHRWPYVTYSGSYSSFLHSRGSVSNGSTFSSHLNSQSAPSEIPTSCVFPPIDVYNHVYCSTHLSSLQQAAAFLVLVSSCSHQRLKGYLGTILVCRDQHLLSLHQLLTMGKPKPPYVVESLMPIFFNVIKLVLYKFGKTNAVASSAFVQ